MAEKDAQPQVSEPSSAKMHRARSARSDMSDADLDGMAEREAELQRLQRQIRIMEGDRKAYCLESQDTIKRQKQEIKTLEVDRQKWLQDLRVIESRSNQTKDDQNVSGLSNLGTEKKEVEDQINEEKARQEELDAGIKDLEKKVRTQHKNMGGANMSRAHYIQMSKKASKMENQLSQANKKFCQALDTNKELREEIDSLRVERKRFDALHKKLEKELHQLKNETSEVIDQSTQAYDSRDEAQSKMIQLQEKADKDLQQHNAEMKELVRIIDHDRKLRDFMNTKSKERQEDPQLVAWRQKKEALEVERKKASQVDSVDSYEAAFERIKEITGEEEIDLLVQKFIEVEDGNFALFNYVNEQNFRIEQLQEKIDLINEEIQQFNKEGVEMESERKQKLKQLEELQAEASKWGDDYNERYTGVMKIIDQLRAGIDSLFKKINCDRSAIDDLLGGQSGVIDKNMLQYLGIIEERTNQLLLVESYLFMQKDHDEYQKRQVSLLGEGPLPQPAPPALGAPGVGDDYDSDATEASDEDMRPFTRNELVGKAMKSVKKRESAMKKEGFQYELSDNKEKSKKKDKKGKH